MSFLGFLTSRVGLGLLAGVFLLTCVWAGWGWGVASRDNVRIEGERARLDRTLNDPTDGYVVRLSTCHASLAGAEASIQTQNAAIDDLRRSSEAATARAAASVRAAQERAQAAERRSQAILQERPRAGEGVCEAAFRLHQENTQ